MKYFSSGLKATILIEPVFGVKGLSNSYLSDFLLRFHTLAVESLDTVTTNSSLLLN